MTDLKRVLLRIVRVGIHRDLNVLAVGVADLRTSLLDALLIRGRDKACDSERVPERLGSNSHRGRPV